MKKVIMFLLKYINLKPMLIELVDVQLEKFVMEAVAESKNKIDDAVVPMVYQALEAKAIAKIQAFDVQKFLEEKEA